MTEIKSAGVVSELRSRLVVGMAATLVVINAPLLLLSSPDHGYFTLMMMFGGNLIVNLLIWSPFAVVARIRRERGILAPRPLVLAAPVFVVVFVHEALLFGIGAYGGC